MAIFMVLGKCENDVFRRIEEQTKEMLSNAQKRSIRFAIFTQDIDVHGEVETIRRGLQAGDTDSTVVHVIFVFDGEEKAAETIKEEMDKLRESLELDGTVERYFHLIWQIHETPYPMYDYEKIGEVLGIGQKKKSGGQFDYVYLISDKRSDLVYDPSGSGYVNGSTLLITRMLLRGRVRGGIYTVGIGQKTVSEHEIRKYAETKLASALENSTLGHQNRMEEICDEAFGFSEDSVSLGIYHYLTRQMINGEFCMVEGETSSKPEIETSFPKNKLEPFFENWQKKLTVMLQKMPFISDGVRFFEENGGFKAYLEDVEKQISTIIQAEAHMVTPPRLFHKQQRAIAEEYNKFVSSRKEAQNALFQKFMQQWRVQGNLMVDIVANLSENWKEYLEFHKESESIIKNCVDQAQEKTREIDKAIASLTFEDIISESKDMRSAESWKWLMGRLCDAIMNNKSVRAIDLMAGVRKLPVDILEDSVLKPIHMSTGVKLACVSHGEQDVFGLPESTFFVPEQLFNSGIERHLPAYSFTEVIAEYQNIEAIALYPIEMDKYEMMTFVAQKPRQGISRPLKAVAESQMKQDKHIITPQEEKKVNAVDENPYDMSVSVPNYKLTLDWSHAGTNSLLCKVISPGEQNRTVVIQRNTYETQGSWDISQLIRRGLHTIELWSKEKCESRIRILGNAEIISLTIKDEKPFRYGTVSICHQTLSVASVDGDEENRLDDRLAENLYFSNGGSQLKMPRPSIKGRQNRQFWEVYRMTDGIPDISAGEEFAGMYQIVIDPT